MIRIISLRRVMRGAALSSLICGLCAIGALAQTPTPRPPTTAPPISPAQRDATRPPGTERRQPIPEQARPNTTNPTAPPGTERPDPQAPPGTSVAPAQTTTTPATPGPTPTTSDALPSGAPTPTPSENIIIGGDIREPVFPSSLPRPLPAPPNLSRLGVTSDNTLTLTLNEAIRRALENNNDIEVARNDVRFAETTLRAFQGVYDPVFAYRPGVNYSIRSQQSSLGGGSEVSTRDISGDTSLNKLFSRGGGNYSFFFNNNRRTTNSSFNQLNPVYSASAGVTFTQPLWRNRSIDDNRRQIRIQRKRLEQSDADFRRRTIEIIAQVQRAYWDLVFALRDQQNQLANLNLTRESLRRVEAQISAGAVAPLERAEVQTELANRESFVLTATQSISVAENNLKQLILRDTQAPEWSAQLTPTDQPSFDSTPVNLNDALTEARGNRPELRRLNLQRDINSIDIQYFKNQAQPRIDLEATIATNGLSGTPQAPVCAPGTPNNVLCVPANLVGGYGQTLRNLTNFDTRDVVVGINIQIPLRNRTARANLAGANIQRTQLEASTRLQEQFIEVEVRNSAQAVETSRQRVISARAARQNAELQLQGEQRLYQVGRSTTFLLFQRENALTNARNLELRAETDYNIALADLQRATSTTLRANNVIVETPTVP